MHFQIFFLTAVFASTSLTAPVALRSTSPFEFARRTTPCSGLITALSPPAGTGNLPGPVETIPLPSEGDFDHAKDLISDAVRQAAPLLEHEAWREYKRFVARLRKLLGHEGPLAEQESGVPEEQHGDEDVEEDGEYDHSDSLAWLEDEDEEDNFFDEKWEL